MNVLAEVAKGLKANIYAVDNLAPVSRVAVYVRAGSRYEPDAVPGISHVLKASAGLTTHDSSIFGIARHMERAGASFKVTSNREYIIYRVDCLRDKLGYVLPFIDDTIHKPEFRSWELHDVVKPRLHEELERYRKNQSLVANEAMHKAAYRGGLAHSLFTPEHQIERINKNDVREYFENNYVLDRMSFVGLGVDESELRSIVEERFQLNGSEFKGVTGESRYVGGEARIQANFPQTMVNFVVQGSPISDLKSVAALEVLTVLIGGSPYVKYGSGTPNSLGHLLNKMAPGFNSSIININHSDTGLFGISIVGPNAHLKKATKESIKLVRNILTGVNEEHLKVAKKAAIARALIASEDQCAVFKYLGRGYAAGIVGNSPLNHIEKLTLKDIQSVASNLHKSKPTMVSIGNPRFVPYVDEIDQ